MLTIELQIDGDKKSADFSYEFETREIWNLGYNIKKIILSGLKEFKSRVSDTIINDELWTKIDILIQMLEDSITNEFEFVDTKEKEIFLLYGEISKWLWI
jgi:hypothetical protein